MQKKVLRTVCYDAKGLIAKITAVCYKHQLNIIQNNEFVDHQTHFFFMRTELEGVFNDDSFLADIDNVLPDGSQQELITVARKKVVVAVTKEAHCIGDLLIKSIYGDLDIDIVAVISNYDSLQPLIEKFNIPFYFISHKGLTHQQHEIMVTQIIDTINPDYFILAKYMRILTPDFVSRYSNKIINIHHSFLPAFIGARPYHQAYQRGVKIIGATAHFVNDNLDEGPIIVQDVIPVDHSYLPEDMMRAGRDVEKIVLSKALFYLLSQRVFVYNNRTVIL